MVRPFRRCMIGASAAILIHAAACFALQTTQATSAPAGGTVPLQIVVTQVQGTAQYRLNEDQDWMPAKAGLVLPEGVEFSTMKPSSALQFRIPPDQVYAVDRMTTVRITKASFQNGKLVTSTEMDTGRLRLDIEGAGVEHDSTIYSPNATLAVRGTQVTLYDQAPYAPTALSLTGRAQFRDARKAIAFGSKGGGRVAVNTQSDTPAQLALQQTVVDPSIARARTATEATLVAQLLTRGASEFFDPVRGIEVIRGGTPPPPQALARNLPGLSVFVSWSGNADLNLGVGRQSTGEFLYPVAGLSHYPNGDFIPFDHQGGPKGGIELADFPSIRNVDKVNETLTVTASHISGAATALAFQTFMNGKPLAAHLFDLNTLQFSDTFTTSVSPGGAAVVELPTGQNYLSLLLASGGGGQLPGPPSTGSGQPPGGGPLPFTAANKRHHFNRRQAGAQTPAQPMGRAATR